MKSEKIKLLDVIHHFESDLVRPTSQKEFFHTKKVKAFIDLLCLAQESWQNPYHLVLINPVLTHFHSV
jgi:hypothetical protein